jgi:type III secretory pathway component EscU
MKWGHRGAMASTFCLAAAGVFFLFGLVFGAWKYACITRSPRAQAPVYVDVAHRAALLYAFACMLLGQLCAASAWRTTTNLIAVIVLVSYFAVSVIGYAVHGALRDTDNQLMRPHQLGTRTIGNGAMLTFMMSLVLAEVGAFVVVLSGYLANAAS